VWNAFIHEGRYLLNPINQQLTAWRLVPASENVDQSFEANWKNLDGADQPITLELLNAAEKERDRQLHTIHTPSTRNSN
jgi:hypothetical protein